MRGRWIGVIAAAVMLGLGTAGTAAAEDFNFTIPVKILSLAPPDIGGNVGCQVGVGAPPSPAGWGALASGVGGGGTAFDVDANGSFQGTVSVKFNAQQGKNPGTATHWACVLFLRQPNGSARADVVAPSRGKQGAPLVWTVSGALP